MNKKRKGGGKFSTGTLLLFNCECLLIINIYCSCIASYMLYDQINKDLHVPENMNWDCLGVFPSVTEAESSGTCWSLLLCFMINLNLSPIICCIFNKIGIECKINWFHIPLYIIMGSSLQTNTKNIQVYYMRQFILEFNY